MRGPEGVEVFKKWSNGFRMCAMLGVVLESKGSCVGCRWRSCWKERKRMMGDGGALYAVGC